MRCGCHSILYKKNYKTHDTIIGTRYYNLPEHFSTPRWDIKQPQPSGNHIGVFKPRLYQYNDHVWTLFTIKQRHHQQHEADNSGINFTMIIKLMRWVLIHVTCYWKKTPLVNMDIATNKKKLIQRVDNLATKEKHTQFLNVAL